MPRNLPQVNFSLQPPFPGDRKAAETHEDAGEPGAAQGAGGAEGESHRGTALGDFENTGEAVSFREKQTHYRLSMFSKRT